MEWSTAGVTGDLENGQGDHGGSSDSEIGPGGAGSARTSSEAGLLSMIFRSHVDLQFLRAESASSEQQESAFADFVSTEYDNLTVLLSGTRSAFPLTDEGRLFLSSVQAILRLELQTLTEEGRPDDQATVENLLQLVREIRKRDHAALADAGGGK